VPENAWADNVGWERKGWGGGEECVAVHAEQYRCWLNLSLRTVQQLTFPRPSLNQMSTQSQVPQGSYKHSWRHQHCSWGSWLCGIV